MKNDVRLTFPTFIIRNSFLLSATRKNWTRFSQQGDIEARAAVSLLLLVLQAPDPHLHVNPRQGATALLFHITTLLHQWTKPVSSDAVKTLPWLSFCCVFDASRYLCPDENKGQL